MKKIFAGLLSVVLFATLGWGAAQDFKGTINGNTITAGTGTVTISPAITITATQNTSLDETVAMSAKATQVLPTAWTPTYSGSSGSIGAAAGSFSGTYTKVGKLCTIVGSIRLSNAGSWTGNVVIGNLPFAAATGEYLGIIYLENIVYTGAVHLYTYTGQTIATIVITATGTGGSSLGCAAVTNTGAFVFSLTYLTN